MALRKDETTSAGRGRVVDATHTYGDVIYRSDFDSGFDGWIDHWNGFRPLPIVSLTTEMQLRGSRCLMLSTGEDVYSSTAWDNTCTVFKRLALYRARRFHSFSAWVAVGVGAYNATWLDWEMLLDAQKFDDSSRSLYHLRTALQPSPDFDRIELTDNAGGTVVVPASTHKTTGRNENKQGFNYVRLTVDTQANSGAGGYHEAQVNQSIFDLSGLAGQSAAQAPQGGTGQDIDEFNGGLNIGFSVTRNTNTGGCQLFVDDVVYAVSDTWA